MEKFGKMVSVEKERVVSIQFKEGVPPRVYRKGSECVFITYTKDENGQKVAIIHRSCKVVSVLEDEVVIEDLKGNRESVPTIFFIKDQRFGVENRGNDFVTLPSENEGRQKEEEEGLKDGVLSIKVDGNIVEYRQDDECFSYQNHTPGAVPNAKIINLSENALDVVSITLKDEHGYQVFSLNKFKRYQQTQ
jgi:hypothetical protein